MWSLETRTGDRVGGDVGRLPVDDHLRVMPSSSVRPGCRVPEESIAVSVADIASPVEDPQNCESLTHREGVDAYTAEPSKTNTTPTIPKKLSRKNHRPHWPYGSPNRSTASADTVRGTHSAIKHTTQTERCMLTVPGAVVGPLMEVCSYGNCSGVQLGLLEQHQEQRVLVAFRPLRDRPQVCEARGFEFVLHDSHRHAVTAAVLGHAGR